jgi:hypothetical protein
MWRVRQVLGVAVVSVCAVAAPLVVASGTAPAATGDIGFAITKSGEGCILARIELGTGNITDLSAPTSQLCAEALAFGPDGRLWGASGSADQVMTYDSTPGSPTFGVPTATSSPIGLGSDSHNRNVTGLSFDAAGALWLSAELAPSGTPPATGCGGSPFQCLFRIDQSNGTGSVIGPINAPAGRTLNFLQGMAASCAQGVVVEYSESGSSLLRLATLDTTSGQLTDRGSNGADVEVSGIDFATDGTLWGLGTAATLPKVLALEPATGGAAVVADLGGKVELPAPLAVAPVDPCPAPAPLVVEVRFTG